jgi:hypothetical protein
MARPRKTKGLGDVIENITHATGIDKVVHAIAGDDCGCKERKEYLNKLFPFGKRVVNCLTDEQKEYLGTFFELNPNTIYPIQQRELSEIYKHVFDRIVDTNCASCWRDIIKDLKNVYDENNS